MTDRLAPDLKALKATTHALVDAVGGTVAAQVICGHRSPSTVSAAASISFPDRYMALDDLMVLERHAQQPIVSAWLVARHQDNPSREARPVSIEDVGLLAKEGAEAKMAIVNAYARRRADGSFTEADRLHAIAELRDLEALARERREALEAQG